MPFQVPETRPGGPGAAGSLLAGRPPPAVSVRFAAFMLCAGSFWTNIPCAGFCSVRVGAKPEAISSAFATSAPRQFAHGAPPFPRVAYAAAHVVIDPLAEQDPWVEPAVGWERTVASRRYLWSLGLGVAEAIDTAQRGMGLDWVGAKTLTRHNLDAMQDVPGAATASGAGTDHLDPDVTVDDVIRAYEEQQNIVFVKRQQSILLQILKTGDAPTLSVVSGIKAALPQLQKTLPPGITITLLNDQSGFVIASIEDVVQEMLTTAVLAGLMVLLFVGSWRSTLIVATSIPLAIFSSIIALAALGQTINVMTLGGLALAVGILVDDATVMIENINTTWRRAARTRLCTTRSWRRRTRSWCRPLFPRCASASYGCPCSSLAASPATCSCQWRKRSSSP